MSRIRIFQYPETAGLFISGYFYLLDSYYRGENAKKYPTTVVFFKLGYSQQIVIWGDRTAYYYRIKTWRYIGLQM